jgi:hypothetical protein
MAAPAPAAQVALRTEGQQPPGRLQRPGAQFRPGEIRIDLARAAALCLGAAQVVDHAQPGVRPVVGAVDAHDIHAGGQQAGDQARVVGRRRRHGHHDPRGTLAGRRAEQFARVLGEPHRAAGRVHRRLPRRFGFAVPGQARQRGQHRFEVGERIGLAAAQPAQAEQPEFLLRLAQVDLAQAQVMQQVARAVAKRRMRRIDLARVPRLDAEGAFVQRTQRRDQAHGKGIAWKVHARRREVPRVRQAPTIARPLRASVSVP